MVSSILLSFYVRRLRQGLSARSWKISHTPHTFHWKFSTSRCAFSVVALFIFLTKINRRRDWAHELTPPHSEKSPARSTNSNSLNKYFYFHLQSRIYVLFLHLFTQTVSNWLGLIIAFWFRDRTKNFPTTTSLTQNFRLCVNLCSFQALIMQICALDIGNLIDKTRKDTAMHTARSQLESIWYTTSQVALHSCTSTTAFTNRPIGSDLFERTARIRLKLWARRRLTWSVPPLREVLNGYRSDTRIEISAGEWEYHLQIYDLLCTTDSHRRGSECI